ncbi:MAG: outer membrane beta-barrel protein [bacterium]
MSPRIHAVIAATILLAAPLAARAQASLNIAAGMNAPMSDLGDVADIGYTVAAGLNFKPLLLPVGFRLEGAYNGLNLKDSNGDVRIISGTANLVFSLSPLPSSPYLIGGIGLYNSRVNFTGLGSAGDKTAFGINGGGGLRFPLVGFTPYFETRYHVMLGNKNDGTNYQFIPITFGVLF